MNRLQYIGARYVPKFSEVNGGEWSSTYSYEPLTIVKNGADFYTSKIPVPVGIAITDSTYWVKTGDYNGAISQLSDEIDELIEKSAVKFLFPKLTQDYDGDSVGLCMVVRCNDGEGIIFDFGAVESATTICNQLIAYGVTKIKAAFISHYHMDHISEVVGLNTFKAMLDMSETVFYSAVAETSLASRFNSVRAIFSNNTFLFPDSGDVIEFENLKVTCLNCGASANAYWDSVASGDGNDYSMLNYIEYFDNRVFFMSDAPKRVQDKIVSDRVYKNAQLVVAPHHGVNSSGSIDLALETGAELIYASDSAVSYSTGLGYPTKDPFIGAMQHFGARYYTQTMNAKMVIFGAYGDTGISTSDCHYEYATQYDDSSVIDIYVDSSKSKTSLNIGSQQHPYISLPYAISKMRQDLRYNVHLLANETSDAIFAHKTFTLEGGNHTVGNLYIRDGFATVNDINCNEFSISRANVRVNRVTLKQMSATDSQVHVDTFTTKEDITDLFRFYYSQGAITGTRNNSHTITNMVTGNYSIVFCGYSYNASDGFTHIFGGTSTNNVFRCLDAANGTSLLKIYGDATLHLCKDNTSGDYVIVSGGAVVKTLS